MTKYLSHYMQEQMFAFEGRDHWDHVWNAINLELRWGPVGKEAAPIF